MLLGVLFSVNVNGQWLPGQCPVGVDPYVVETMTSWDPDGLGPQSDVLVVGGWFSSAGGKACNYIATWDGVKWEPIGAGFTGGNAVYNLTVFNGQLVAGGNFTASDGNPMPGVAQWDGTQWQPMGSETSYITAMAVFNGQLFAGAHYGEDDMYFTHIVRWNGSQWVPVSGSIYGGVNSLVVYANSLVAGGNFLAIDEVSCNYILAWDGGMGWLPIGGNTDSVVYTLAVWNGNLIAGGAFWWVDGVECIFIAQWNGSTWQSVGGGTNGWVTCMTTQDGELYAAGDFTQAGGVNCSHIARWDGSQWNPLSGGLDDRGQSLYHVFALYSWHGGIFEGGADYIVDGLETNFIARWQDNKWHALGNGLDGYVSVFLADGDTLYASGMAQAGGVVCHGLAQWNGQEWSAMGEGLDGGALSLVKYNGNILAGSGGSGTIDINQWNGSEWQPFGGSFRYDNMMFPETRINTMSVQNGNLIVGGQFNKLNENDCGHIAIWDGLAWNTLNGGMSDQVYALAEYNGQLIAGGNFYTAGAVDCNNIARWDGTQWNPLGSGLDGDVRGLAVYNGDLIAVGSFGYAGSVECWGVAKWNGSEWSTMGSLSDSYTVEVYKNKLYVGGDSSGNIAVWDGSLKWQILDSGVDGQVSALETYGEELIVGGNFENAGGEPSANWARWLDPTPACGAWGYFPADIDENCRVDLADFSVIGKNWLTGGCITPLWCQGADVDENGAVGLSDLLEMADQWLSCTDPQGSGCVDQTI
jgi:hypothetical protein